MTPPPSPSGRGGAKRAPQGAKGRPKAAPKGGVKKQAPRPARSAAEVDPPLRGTLRLGAIEGAMPGKWVDTWRERYPQAALDLLPLSPATQRDALAGGRVDAALVRQPMDAAGLHLIPLYDEVAVVVCGADSHLTAAEELRLDDLVGEVVITPVDPPLTVEVPDALCPAFAAPAGVEEAIAIVASGVGVVVVPMSLARLYHRKDAAWRPLVDAPLSPVALAWPRDADSPLIDAFVGIVRGRTARSSR